MIKITIVYDNDSHHAALPSDWGFSCLVDAPDQRLLFDTGTRGELLLANLSSLNIDLTTITSIFLTHQHGDHLGGLGALLSVLSSAGVTADICLPQSFSERLKNDIKRIATLREISEPAEIGTRFISTGELGSGIKEQSLLIRTGETFAVLTGCAHPGLETILAKAREFGEISAVIGGFHGFKTFDILRDIPLIVPCHCTTYKRELLQMFPTTAKTCGTGFVIDLHE